MMEGARVIVQELMAALKKDYNISPDADLHGIMGASSAGCAAFAVAWFRPDDFRKVITIVGGFTSIRGEHIFPELVAESEKKPIPIFMQDGRNDNRRPGNPNGDWFYQNVRLMKALTKKGYEVNYARGIGSHGQKQGGAIFPGIRWFWRKNRWGKNRWGQTHPLNITRSGSFAMFNDKSDPMLSLDSQCRFASGNGHARANRPSGELPPGYLGSPAHPHPRPKPLPGGRLGPSHGRSHRGIQLALCAPPPQHWELGQVPKALKRLRSTV